MTHSSAIRQALYTPAIRVYLLATCAPFHLLLSLMERKKRTWGRITAAMAVGLLQALIWTVVLVAAYNRILPPWTDHVIATLVAGWGTALALLLLLGVFVRHRLFYTVGVLAVLAGTTTAVGCLVHPWEYAWAVMFGKGSVGDYLPRGEEYNDEGIDAHFQALAEGDGTLGPEHPIQATGASGSDPDGGYTIRLPADGKWTAGRYINPSLFAFPSDPLDIRTFLISPGELTSLAGWQEKMLAKYWMPTVAGKTEYDLARMVLECTSEDVLEATCYRDFVAGFTLYRLKCMVKGYTGPTYSFEAPAVRGFLLMYAVREDPQCEAMVFNSEGESVASVVVRGLNGMSRKELRDRMLPILASITKNEEGERGGVAGTGATGVSSE